MKKKIITLIATSIIVGAHVSLFVKAAETDTNTSQKVILSEERIDVTVPERHTYFFTNNGTCDEDVSEIGLNANDVLTRMEERNISYEGIFLSDNEIL